MDENPASTCPHIMFMILHSFNDIADKSREHKMPKLCMIGSIIKFPSMRGE